MDRHGSWPTGMWHVNMNPTPYSQNQNLFGHQMMTPQSGSSNLGQHELYHHQNLVMVNDARSLGGFTQVNPQQHQSQIPQVVFQSHQKSTSAHPRQGMGVGSHMGKLSSVGSMHYLIPPPQSPMAESSPALLNRSLSTHSLGRPPIQISSSKPARLLMLAHHASQPQINTMLPQGTPTVSQLSLASIAAGSISPSRRRIRSDSDSTFSIRKKSKSSRERDCQEPEFGEPDGLEGERRLVIKFESFGTKGESPQAFGKRGLIIPDGLIGTHTAYEELWRFEVHHTDVRAGVGNATCIRWKITNIKSGDAIEQTETPKEAEQRCSQGWTITSRIFREALKRRADHLEASLKGEINPIREANIRSLIQSLRPNTFTQGPLVFGLKHKVVQEKMMEAESQIRQTQNPSSILGSPPMTSSHQKLTHLISASSSSSLSSLDTLKF